APGDHGRELDRPLAGHGAQRQRAVVLAHVGERRDAVHVDERGRAREPEIQHRHQALTAGEYLGVAAVSHKQLDGLVDTAGRVVVEARRLHARSLARAAWISACRRVGVIGSSVMLMPSGRSASLTALAMTAGTVIEDDSPRPLEPSVVSGEGETTCAISISGASPAVGTR